MSSSSHRLQMSLSCLPMPMLPLGSREASHVLLRSLENIPKKCSGCWIHSPEWQRELGRLVLRQKESHWDILNAPSQGKSPGCLKGPKYPSEEVAFASKTVSFRPWRVVAVQAPSLVASTPQMCYLGKENTLILRGRKKMFLGQGL